MNELMTIKTYEEFEQAFDHEIRNQAESFIRMGYLLRVAQDTDILYESQYNTIAEFAKARYNLSPDYVSRMIEVNKRYSEGGYSDRLPERYRGYGYTLLSEMLTLSDQVVDALPENITREDIRDIKREIKEEQKISDIEVMLETPEPAQEVMDNNLVKVLHQYWREHIREYPAMFKNLTKSEQPKETVMSYLAPSGFGVLMVRVRGIGKFMLSIKDDNKDLELLNIRTNETETYTWDECVCAMQQLCKGKNYKEAFLLTYSEPYPEETKRPENLTERPREKKPEIVPAQEKRFVENTETIEVQKVNVDEKEEICNTEIEVEGEVPGQQSIEAYEEVLPEGYHAGTEIVTRQEIMLWKDAKRTAEALANTLTEKEWNHDYLKLVNEMCIEAGNLKIILENLREMMEHPE